MTIHRADRTHARLLEVATLPAGYYLACRLLDITFGVAHTTEDFSDEAIAAHMQHTHARAACRACRQQWHGGLGQRKLTHHTGLAPIDLDNAEGKETFDRLDCPACHATSSLDVTFGGPVITSAA